MDEHGVQRSTPRRGSQRRGREGEGGGEMSIFILAITTYHDGIVSIYPAATIAENKDDALARGFRMAQDQYPDGMHNVVCDDATDYINLHHVNGEVVK
jgi:hypothetical protein